MRKVGEEIEEDIYKLVSANTLATTVSGKVCREGTRPFNSQFEDIVISFLTGLDGQKQTGLVNINVYVPDVDSGDSLLVKNTARCKAIATELNTFKESLMTPNWTFDRSGYKFLSSGKMIMTYEVEEIHQHFVNLEIKFEYLTV